MEHPVQLKYLVKTGPFFPKLDPSVARSVETGQSNRSVLGALECKFLLLLKLICICTAKPVSLNKRKIVSKYFVSVAISPELAGINPLQKHCYITYNTTSLIEHMLIGTPQLRCYSI